MGVESAPAFDFVYVVEIASPLQLAQHCVCVRACARTRACLNR